ncbi:hypothetical protein DXT87_12235 [Arthrobacter sp. AET 35A]|nr:hypothetical protein [Arthrobacter sp. AET 35A]
MGQAQAQHIFAPYSLIRAALETASAGLWILADDSPRETAIRALRLESINLAEVSKAYETVQGTDADTTHRRAILDDAIVRNGFQRENIKGRAPGSLKIIQAACEAFDAGTTPVLMWQMCSAATHGRNWISGFLTMMDAQDDLQSKIIAGRLTSDEQGIVLAMYAACDLVRRLFRVQMRRYTKHAHTGESFMSPQLVLPQTGLFLPSRRM